MRISYDKLVTFLHVFSLWIQCGLSMLFILEYKRIDRENTRFWDEIHVNQTSISETIGSGSGTKKDTTIKSVKPNAIIHNAPEQEKIDSIKNAKTKNKR